MKKIITIIFFFLTFIVFSFAQKTSTKTKTTTTKTTSKTPSTTTKTSTTKPTMPNKATTTSSTTPAKAIYTPLKEDGTLKWLTFEEAIKLNETKPAQFFIDFYTSWCGWCKVLDTKTFQDPFVAKFMSEHFYCVKFDAEQKPDINFQNKTWKWIAGGRNGYHELAAFFMQGQMSYPTCTVLTSKFELVYPLKGYVKVEEFEPLITFLGKELYKTPNNNYEEYKSKYKR
jgi:thioredoxin-related protein